MAAKTDKTPRPVPPGQCVKQKPPRKSVECLEGKTERNYVEVLCGPALAAYRVISAADGKQAFFKDVDIKILMEHLRDQAGAVQGGDMSQAEAMLNNQAIALQSLFVRLVERGLSQTIMPNLEAFMKLALRAQNQCRATLETLATIKNPPVVFARQANFANGLQQVNNGKEAPPAHGKINQRPCFNILQQPGAPRARENKIEQNQLLETTPDERLDFGKTATAGENDQTMATVGAINRATNRGGKTGQRKARL